MIGSFSNPQPWSGEEVDLAITIPEDSGTVLMESRIDDQEWTHRVSPISFSAQTPGRHALEIRARTLDGYRSFSWKQDFVWKGWSFDRNLIGPASPFAISADTRRMACVQSSGKQIVSLFDVESQIEPIHEITLSHPPKQLSYSGTGQSDCVGKAARPDRSGLGVDWMGAAVATR